MRKLIASMMLTLDGVMEAPGGEPGHPHSGWVHPPANKEFLQYKLNETLGAESLHLARAGGARTGKMPQLSAIFLNRIFTCALLRDLAC